MAAFIWIVCAAALTTVLAQGQRASPHETVSATVHGAKVSISYGRPYVKGRTIMGYVVPLGTVWRTGADEATTLVTDHALMIGGVHVTPGTYTLYTLPGEKEWKLIVNSETGQWGTEYTQARDLGRVDMRVGRTGALVEQLTLSIAEMPAGGELRLQWERTDLTVPFTVMR